MTQLSQGPFGTYTPQAAATIQAAIAQAGFGTTGTIYYLNPVNGYDGNDGLSVATAVQSLGQGYALLASGKNDVLVLIGNGAASGSARLSAGFTWAKDAAHLIGICAPSRNSQRARIAPTAGIAAFANFFTVSGNGCYFGNLQFFHGFAVGVAASICLTVTGQRNVFDSVSVDGMGDAASAASATSRNLKISGGGQENYFRNCSIGLDTVTRTNANASIEIAGGGPRNTFEDCLFPFLSGDGATLGLLTANAAALDRWILFKNCIFVNCMQSGATVMATLCTLVAAQGGMALFHGCGLFGITKIGGANATNDGQIYTTMSVASTASGLAVNPV